MRTLTLIFAGLLISSSFIAQATDSLSVTVFSSSSNPTSVSPIQFNVTFEGEPRLSQVVSQGAELVRKNTLEHDSTLVHQSDPIYWLGAGLFSNTDNNEIQRQRDHTLKALSDLSNAWEADTDAHRAVTSLMTFIESSVFQKRFLVELDEDSFLADNVNNPLITDDMTLVLPLRPHTIHVVGAVVTTTRIPFSPIKQADDYIDDATSLYTFGNNSVSVIQPNGSIESHDIAYWNKVPRNLAPGAVIFVPFKGLSSEYSFLNETIPQLLQHRVM